MPPWQLSLFDSWRLYRADNDVPLHRREQRLVALLALQGGRPRGYLAGVLWPDSNEHRAAGNLRAAVWSTEHLAPGLLIHDRSELRLADTLWIDVAESARRARRVLSWRERPEPVDRAACVSCLHALLHGDLLPGWYEDWVSYERARLAQLRLRSLEVLADLLVDCGEREAALAAATAAVAIEPLHEPATRALIRVEIADGNHSAAVRHYECFRSRLQAEVGVAPSGQLDKLIRPLLIDRGGRRLRRASA